MIPDTRALCLRCLRPQRVCYCAHLPSLPTKTKLVFLQHARERRMPIGTARMAHLSLPNSELHVGIEFEGDPRIESVAQEPGTFILFPGEGARDVRELSPGELKTLIVVDGTWPLAKKLIRVNPTLQRVQKVAFTPERPGNYRIRREPAEHCLSTIEAVAEVLGHLEGDRVRFREMLKAFDAMVDTQIACKEARVGPTRYVKLRPKTTPPAEVKVAEELRGYGERLVLVYAESNSIDAADGTRSHELIHLVASRPATGERFEARLRPSEVLSESTPHHVELPAELFVDGEDRAEALARFRAFLRERDVVSSWGYFSWDLVRPLCEGSEFIDLRERVVRVMHARPGGLDETAVKLGGVLPTSGGRAIRRIAALEHVLGAVFAKALPRQRKGRKARPPTAA